MTALTFADVAAGVANTIAAYTHALDDGRTDDVVATYCADGGCDIPGLGTCQGHDAPEIGSRGCAESAVRISLSVGQDLHTRPSARHAASATPIESRSPIDQEACRLHCRWRPSVRP